MAFGDELINVESFELVAGRLIKWQSNNIDEAGRMRTGLPTRSITSRRREVASSSSRLAAITSVPPMSRSRRTGETGRADFVVGDRVRLWFSPGATLVPMTVGSGAGARKVLIEIQGYIDAGIHQIFDVMLDPSNISADAGEVMFTRSGVRQVYPEWWGAVPAPPDFESVNDAGVRRTTKALQAAIVRGARAPESPIDPNSLLCSRTTT